MSHLIQKNHNVSILIYFRHHWVVDTTRLRAELGYMEVVPQEEALRRTVEWQWADPLAKYDPKEFDYATEDTVLAELEQTVEP
jgi:hypothetical protein